MADTLVFMAVPRPGGEDLRLVPAEFQGRSFANLRLWFQAADGE